MMRIKLSERTERKHVRDSLNMSRLVRDRINNLTNYNGWRFLNYIMVQKEKMNMDNERTELLNSFKEFKERVNRFGDKLNRIEEELKGGEY